MKTLIALILFSSAALAQNPTKVDLGLSVGVFATHAGDYLSTEQFLHNGRAKEVVLPRLLVHRDGLLAGYEFTTATVEVFSAYELAKHGHPKLARTMQAINIGFTARTVADNYESSWRTPRLNFGGK